ncbi:MAG: hypothetical protein ACLTAF_02480 [Blautia coccoides]
MERCGTDSQKYLEKEEDLKPSPPVCSHYVTVFILCRKKEHHRWIVIFRIFRSVTVVRDQYAGACPI